MQMWLYKLVSFSSCISRGVQNYLLNEEAPLKKPVRLCYKWFASKGQETFDDASITFPDVSERPLCTAQVHVHFTSPWKEKSQNSASGW